MVFLILISSSFCVILFSVLMGVAIFYHLKKFGLPEDPIIKKALNIFKIGLFLFVGLNILILILNLK